jgi:ABC-type phosphate transport system permease subunit
MYLALFTVVCLYGSLIRLILYSHIQDFSSRFNLLSDFHSSIVWRYVRTVTVAIYSCRPPLETSVYLPTFHSSLFPTPNSACSAVYMTIYDPPPYTPTPACIGPV